MYMEKIIEERILENLNDEEEKEYIKNKSMLQKVYVVGLLDNLTIEKN